MNKVIVYKNKDDTIGILSAPDSGRRGVEFDARDRPIRFEPEDVYLTRMAECDVPNGTSWKIIPKSDIPNNRTLRDAWGINLDTEKITINNDKAKEIILVNTRQERNTKLEELDGPELRALGQNNNTELQKIRKVKQQLRDLPVTVTDDIMSKGGNFTKLENYKVKFPTMEDVTDKDVESSSSSASTPSSSSTSNYNG